LSEADFRRKLLGWYRIHYRRLPWRETRDPYRIWVSEVMLQQTTVQAVLPYYAEWLRRYPDVESLSRAPLNKILKSWQGLGYYQRARNLQAAARVLVRDFGGRIPQDFETLRKLPGFGPYTAAAVLSLAFNLPYPVIEANVRRVMMRLLRIPGESGAHQDGLLRGRLEALFPRRNPGLFNQAMMELGALVCRSRQPQCLACPVTAHCRAYEHGDQEIIPRPKKTSVKRFDAVIAVIKRGGKVLIQKRPGIGLLAGLWEFPGGKIEAGETRERALRREIREELGAELLAASSLLKVKHAYTRFEVTLYVYDCTLKKGPALKRSDLRWVGLKSLRHYPFPSGSAKIVDFLEKQHTIEHKDVLF
jgi:A/G-specific adenine glycosylase